MQEHKRESIERVLKSVLKKKIVRLTPKSITCHESEKSEFTTVDYSFEEEIEGNKKIIVFEGITGKGFIDCLFESCLKHYESRHESLSQIRLVDLYVQPIFSAKERSFGSRTDVVLKVSVSNLGDCEFRKRSRSIIYSAFSTILSTFQFYINCQRAFDCLILTISDAKKRNREDIISSCKYKLSEITSVNRYERKK